MTPDSSSDPRGRFSFSRRVWVGGVVLAILAAVGLWRWYAVTRPDYLLQRGQAALQAGIPDDAWNWLDALERRGYKDHALLLRGEILFRSGDVAPALKLFAAVPESNPLHLDAVAWSGRCLLELRLITDAERAFQFVLSRQADHVDAHRGLAAVYYDMGAYPLAAAHCREWARLEPRSGAPYRFRGAMSKNIDQFADAVTEFREALARELPPALQDEVRWELAESLVKLNRFAEALAELDSLSPRVEAVKGAALRAEALRGLGRGEEAAALLDRALEQDPNNVEALRLRGALHLDEGEADQAAVVFEKAVAVAPRHYRARVQLAAAYGALGKTAAAKAQTQQANEIQTVMLGLADLTRKLHQDSRNPALHERMADLYAELNMTEHAAKSRRLAKMLADNKQF